MWRNTTEWNSDKRAESVWTDKNGKWLNEALRMKLNGQEQEGTFCSFKPCLVAFLYVLVCSVSCCSFEPRSVAFLHVLFGSVWLSSFVMKLIPVLIRSVSTSLSCIPSFSDYSISSFVVSHVARPFSSGCVQFVHHFFYMSCCILNTLLSLEFLGIGGIQSTINTFSLSKSLLLASFNA